LVHFPSQIMASVIATCPVAPGKIDWADMTDESTDCGSPRSSIQDHCSNFDNDDVVTESSPTQVFPCMHGVVLCPMQVVTQNGSAVYGYVPMNVACVGQCAPTQQHLQGMHPPLESVSVCGDAVHRTTVMLKNLPNNLERSSFLALLDDQGLHGLYDFVHLPIDLQRSANLGFAFVNMTSPAAAELLFCRMQGFHTWPGSSRKRCEVVWNDSVQGLNALVEKFRNSPLMHRKTPDEARPAVFQNGSRVSFPPATATLKPLRLPKASSGRTKRG